jgi:UDP-N-acetylglucosamine 1-carboxyvinyltransferase
VTIALRPGENGLVSRFAASRSYRVRKSALEGTVRVSGAKNSALRLLAASLLTSNKIVLDNFPSRLLDARIHLGMLEALGKRWELSGDSLTLAQAAPPPPGLVWEGPSIRGTLLILGALTARTGQGAVPLPGGCNLENRKHDLHVMVLERLGAEVESDGTRLRARARRGLVGADIHLPIRSTGATENAILCATLARGTTRIWGPHIRPEILDLIAMLRAMGARIEVFGQQSIEVEGVDDLRGVRHAVIQDGLEALTWLVAAVITGGRVVIEGFPHGDLELPLIHLRESGARFSRTGTRLCVEGGTCYPLEISTGPYPGINSDMQPILAVYGAMARGRSRIVDLRFPGRYGYAAELAGLGVDTTVDGGMLVIAGGRPLAGARVRALDLRAGIALVLAGMCAEGETIIEDAWQIERGYDRFLEKARALGARIEQDGVGRA